MIYLYLPLNFLLKYKFSYGTWNMKLLRKFWLKPFSLKTYVFCIMQNAQCTKSNNKNAYKKENKTSQYKANKFTCYIQKAGLQKYNKMSNPGYFIDRQMVSKLNQNINIVSLCQNFIQILNNYKNRPIFIIGSVSIISSNPPCKDCYAWFTTVPLKKCLFLRISRLLLIIKKCAQVTFTEKSQMKINSLKE